MDEAPVPAVAIRGLFKRYDQVVAVGGVDLDVARGSFFGLVGPNGAGKTTTLRIATGLLRPDAGTVWIGGIEVWHDPVRAKATIGVLPDDLRLFERLTGAELLEYGGLLRGLPPAEVLERSQELLAVLDLRDAADTMVVDYSTGMRKKIALGAALLHAPSVLFLDEPFESVDPVSTRTIRDVLRRFTGAGGTVVFSSHVMEVVERLCDSVAIMHRGRIVGGGSVAQVCAGRSLEDVFVELVGARPADTSALDWLGR